MSKELVYQKTEKASGGNNNYWLVEITDRSNKEVVVEAEDVIEFFRMDFALATVFKSIWRLCRLRQGLGKPGSSMLYESQKCAYYSDRSYALTYRHKGYLLGRVTRSLFNLLLGKNIFSSISDRVTITHPKRLDPYTFDINDLITALEPSKLEGEILLYTLKLAQIRHHPRIQFDKEAAFAKVLVNNSKSLEQREQIVANRAKAP